MSGKESDPKKESGLRLDISSIFEEETLHQWVIEPEMFADCAEPIPLKGPVKAEGRISRTGKTISFFGTASCVFGLVCSRCAAEFEMPAQVNAQAVFLPKQDEETGEVIEENAGEVDTVYYDEDHVDFFGPLRDQITLATPMRPLCKEDCKGICPNCGADWNKAGCDCEEATGDPRFAKLKKLFNSKEGENAGS